MVGEGRVGKAINPGFIQRAYFFLKKNQHCFIQPDISHIASGNVHTFLKKKPTLFYSTRHFYLAVPCAIFHMVEASFSS